MSVTLDTLRRQIDNLDEQILDLLNRRAELIPAIVEEKKKAGAAAVQPAREAAILRRLAKKKTGPFPRESVIRIWREIIGASSLMQTPQKVAVCVDNFDEGLLNWDLAKDYFSSIMPIHRAANVLGALASVREGEATFAVLPWPKIEDSSPWWLQLMSETGEFPMRIVARLPLGDPGPADRHPAHKALVVARLTYQPSGEDCSFIALDLDHNVSRTRILDRARLMDFTPLSLFSAAPAGRQRTFHLLEIGQYLGVEDERLSQLLEKLEDPEGKSLCLGGYATPFTYGDRIGKNATETPGKIA